MTSRNARMLVVGILVVTLWILFPAVSTFVTDIWWFGAISAASGSNYSNLFWTIFQTKIVIGAVLSIVLMAVTLLNVWLLHRLAPPPVPGSLQGVVPWALDESELRVFAQRVLYGAGVVVSLLIGISYARPYWEVIQRWIHSAGIEFHDADGLVLVDPLFQKSVAFYILRLPFLEFLSGSFLALFLVIAVLMTAMYFFYGALLDSRNQLNISRRVGIHLGTVYGITFLALAWKHRLSIFDLLYRDHGKFYGAGYVEDHAREPILWILVVLCVIGAVVYLYGVLANKLTPAFVVTGVYFVVLIVGGGVYPQLVTQFKVRPNEQNLQREYIANNIKMTRHAFDLDRAEVLPYDTAGSTMSYEQIMSPEMLNNVRLWDPRPLSEVYQQTQELRPQYDFADVDIDRYPLDGLTRQVTVSARELDTRQLSQGAQTWVNRTFNFTHGYGLVIGPVNEVREGKPHYYVRDIPLNYSAPWTELVADDPGPRIYYGERTSNYVIVNPNSTSPVEFDYPIAGEQFQKYTYTGRGGVLIDSWLRRLVYAAKFTEYNLLLSDDIRDGSRVMYIRTVLDRVTKVAPFLKLDADPYLVVADGRMKWIVDAYMTTGRYPYSRPLEDVTRTFVRQEMGRRQANRVLPRGVPWGNYIRNSVKAVVDVYDGSVTLYRLDRDPALGMEDPLLECYGRIFPSIFRPFSEMPEMLRQHIRYPRTLFWLQANRLCAYHMTDPDTFYLDEDLWELTSEIYEEELQPVEPYYVTMSLPGDEGRPEFLLIYPFAPRGKRVMSAWMAARCDYRPDGSGPQYGQITIYRFPKGSQMFGPEQWESEFLANEEFSNWKKVQSADVRRGNLLLFPLRGGVLGVEPIYLRAQAAPIPMVRQVMAGFVAYSDGTGQIRSAMGATLDDALAKLFGERPARASVLSESYRIAPTTSPDGSPSIGRAHTLYLDAREALRNEDWEEYGRSLEELGMVLEALEQGRGQE